DLRMLRMDAGREDRGLDGLRPAVREEHLGGPLAREDVGDGLRGLHQRNRGEEGRDVLERARLPLDRRDDAGLAMAERDREDAAEEVEIAFALGVEEPLALATDERQRLLVVGAQPVQILAKLL